MSSANSTWIFWQVIICGSCRQRRRCVPISNQQRWGEKPRVWNHQRVLPSSTFNAIHWINSKMISNHQTVVEPCHFGASFFRGAEQVLLKVKTFEWWVSIGFCLLLKGAISCTPPKIKAIHMVLSENRVPLNLYCLMLNISLPIKIANWVYSPCSFTPRWACATWLPFGRPKALRVDHAFLQITENEDQNSPWEHIGR